MGFDFPASPSVGQVSNGYLWDGQRWAGNATPVVPQSEQFFDLSGVTTRDIPVPSWAKSFVMEGAVYTNNALAYPAFLVSWDGSTFLTSGYSIAGPFHDSGTATYQTQGVSAVTSVQLSFGQNYMGIAHGFQCFGNLVYALNQQPLFRVYGSSYDSGAARLVRHIQMSTYMNSVTGSIKALRFQNQGYAMGANSWLRIKWFADAATIPAGTAIADAPADNAEYVRVNGIWRKKCEVFSWTTQRNTYPVICPPAATRLHLVAFVANATPQASGNFGFQGSQNGGSSFNSTSGAYYRGGFFADNPNSVANVAIAAMTYADLAWQSNNISVGTHVIADIALVAQNGQTWAWHSVGGTYFDTGSLQRTFIVNGYMSAGWGGGPINALQFFNANSNMYSGTLECTWGYT